MQWKLISISLYTDSHTHIYVHGYHIEISQNTKYVQKHVQKDCSFKKPSKLPCSLYWARAASSSRLLREGAPAAVLRNVSHACFEDGRQPRCNGRNDGHGDVRNHGHCSDSSDMHHA